MATFAFVISHATDDPTRATLPLVFANAALEEGHQVQVCLIADGVYLMKESVAESIVPVGYPPLKQHLDPLFQKGVPFYV